MRQYEEVEQVDVHTLTYAIYEEEKLSKLPRNKISLGHKRSRLPQTYEIMDTIQMIFTVHELKPDISVFINERKIYDTPLK